MRRPSPIASLAVGIGASLALWMACGGSLRAKSSDRPAYETIVRYGKAMGFRPIAEETVHLRELPLQQLHGKAVVANWEGRTPAPELVLVSTSSSGWRATLGDKNLLRGWRDAVELLLEYPPTELVGISEHSRALAEDLTRILVDPNPSFGVVLSAAEDVPVEHSLSDVARDLQREGLTAEQVVEKFRRGLPSELTAPRIEEGTNGTRVLEFYTWNLHGGSIVGWQVSLGAKPRVRARLIMDGAGSYRHFFY